MSSKLDHALARMNAAMTKLENAFDGAEPPAIWGDQVPDAPGLKANQDEMAKEIRALRARANEDAKLREEAATAVREALRDLRGAVGEGAQNHA
ncbi:MAG: hypothetical protein AB8B85_23895 [Paracoccaceae bacterium]